jgi:hypothetical protein
MQVVNFPYRPSFFGTVRNFKAYLASLGIIETLSRKNTELQETLIRKGQ